MMTFRIITTTCYRRREEAAMVRDFLNVNGWTESAQLSEADLVVFFACSGLRHLSEEKIKQIEATAKQMKPGAELIVGGCLPQMDGERLQQVIPSRTITPTDFSQLDAQAGLKVRIDQMAAIWGPGAKCQTIRRPQFARYLRMLADGCALRFLRFGAKHRWGGSLAPAILQFQRRTTTGFAVAAGCPRRCSYCAKPFASGPLRSKPVDSIVETISAGIRCGYRGFDLYADSIGVYGHDLGTNFGALLERLECHPERFTIGLFDVHPQDFIRYFEPIKRVCDSGKLHYLYVAIQSGNSRVLGLMKRQCDVEDLAEKLAYIRRARSVFMQSGIIAGFPTETDDEFDDTLRFLRRIDFDDVYVHHYCDMPGTEASRMAGKVSADAMQRRFECLKTAGFKYNADAAAHEWAANAAFPIIQ